MADIRFPARARDNRLFFRNVHTESGAHPASYPMGTGGGAVFPGVKRLGREAD
jgi:hypothetical protein